MHGHPTEKPPLRGSYIKYVANHLIFYVFILHKVLRHIGHSPGVNGVREIEILLETLYCLATRSTHAQNYCNQ